VPRAERNQAQAADHLSATQAFGGTSDATVLVRPCKLGTF
jgi:hypothetical protein